MRAMRWAALVLIAPSFSLATHDTASAVTARCDGHPATVVGRPGATAQGTPHRDVIVTHGATGVIAGGGNDLICVTSGPLVRVDAGKGADLVDTRGATSESDVRLGAGRDTFRGGDAPDVVDAADGMPDLVSTGGGDDDVTVGSAPITGPPGHGQLNPGPPEHDRVDLGPGDDTLVSFESNLSTVTGGAGRNSLALVYGGPARLVVDDVHGELRDRGRTVLRFTDMDRFDLGVSTESLTFLGSRQAEQVSLSVLSTRTTPRILIGGGNDVVDLPYQIAHAVDLDLGPGRDQLASVDFNHDPHGAIDVDLATHTLTMRDTTSSVRGVETVHLTAWSHVSFEGSDRPRGDYLTASHSCHVSASGGDGPDYLAIFHQPGRCGGAVLHGDGGNDDLVGGAGDDTLIGGGGRDEAFGQGGYDTCEAELPEHCEEQP